MQLWRKIYSICFGVDSRPLVVDLGLLVYSQYIRRYPQSRCRISPIPPVSSHRANVVSHKTTRLSHPVHHTSALRRLRLQFRWRLGLDPAAMYVPLGAVWPRCQGMRKPCDRDLNRRHFLPASRHAVSVSGLSQLAVTHSLFSSKSSAFSQLFCLCGKSTQDAHD